MARDIRFLVVLFFIYFILELCQYFIWRGMTVGWFFTTTIPRFVFAAWLAIKIENKIRKGGKG